MTLPGYADVLGLDPTKLTLASGQRHDVVLDPVGEVAWRFPRTAAALAALSDSSGRAYAANHLGLGAPPVVDVVLGRLGVARMGCHLVSGVGLSPAVTVRLDPLARAQLVADLTAILGALSTSATEGWPGQNQSWPQRWKALTRRLASEVVPLITGVPQQTRATADLAAADAAADTCAQLGVTHGDLGGENLHIDPVSGAVRGILDWDEAGPGDPAIDLAAILAHAEPWLQAALLTRDTGLRAMSARAPAYTGTFALQEALWGLDDGDADAVERGLAAYR